MPHRYTTPPNRGRTATRAAGTTGQVQSLTRGLSILEALSNAEAGLTLTDLAHRVLLPASSTHRLLSTLEKMRYVYQAGDLGLWYIGLQAFVVGSTFLANRDFVAQSHGYMRRLMEQSGETANLAILDGTEAVFISQVQCHEMMRTLVKLGSRVPLHASGVGKAIFASLPDEQIDAILKVIGLPRITENTIVVPETMWAALRVIRQRGYSFDGVQLAFHQIAPCFETCYFAILLLQHVMQPLDCGECDAAAVDQVDRRVAVAQTEGGVEVLRHRTDVARTGGLASIAPFAHR